MAKTSNKIVLKTEHGSGGALDSLGHIIEEIGQPTDLEAIYSKLITLLKIQFKTSKVSYLSFSLKNQKIEFQYHKNGKSGRLKKELLSDIPEDLGQVREAIAKKIPIITEYNPANQEFIHDELQRMSRIAIPCAYNKRLIGCIYIACRKELVTDQQEQIIWGRLLGQYIGSICGRLIEDIHLKKFKARVRKVINAKISELEIALEQADKYNQSLKDFSYIVSHDLREPLRTINSYIKLLGRRYADQFDEDAKDFMHFISDGAERMDGLIQDLLAFSRIEHSVYEFELVNIENLVVGTCNSLRLKLEESKATIDYSSLPSIIGSKTHLQLLFQNLIDNAIKFRKEDTPPLIQISAHESENYWQFSVKDNGVGMNLENKNNERIFKIFQRLQGFESQIPGTGLGLAICRNIVMAHGGNIWAQSSLGEGSIFHFTISKSLQTD